MVTTLILTHGGLARELVDAAEVILGERPTFRVVTLDWNDSLEQARRKARAVLAELEPGSEILILTDMYGGTPYHVAAGLAEPGRVEVITGVNLPMVVRLGCPGSENKSVGELARWLRSKARKSICLAGEGNGSEVGPPTIRRRRDND